MAKSHTPYTSSALQKTCEAYGSAVAIGQFLEARDGKPFPTTRPVQVHEAEEYLRQQTIVPTPVR